MSIEKMIKLHPHVGSDFNEPLVTAARHAMLCSLFCTSCADACSAEPMDCRQCIRICRDCSDVCDATAHMAMRRTGSNIAVRRAALELCIQACDACAAECDKLDHAHCRLCATMWRECADDCRNALDHVH